MAHMTIYYMHIKSFNKSRQQIKSLVNIPYIQFQGIRNDGKSEETRITGESD